MTAYTFLWNNDTWDKTAPHSPITYIASKKTRPFVNFVAGDEIFVLTVKSGNLYLGGRLIAASSPVSRAQAADSLGRSDLIDKALYVLAQTDQVDTFRVAKLVDLEVAKSLELITSDGASKIPELEKRTGMIDKQAFRSPYQLSPKSASVLRNYLGPPLTKVRILLKKPRNGFTRSLLSQFQSS